MKKTYLAITPEMNAVIEKYLKSNKQFFRVSEILHILDIYKENITTDENRAIEYEIPTIFYGQIFGAILYISAKMAELIEKGEWKYKTIESIELNKIFSVIRSVEEKKP